MKKFMSLSLFVLFFLLFACGQKAEKEIDARNFDTTVKPGDDFYLYANGGWMKNNPIPDEYTSYGIFQLLAEKNRKQLQEIIDQAVSSNAKKGSTLQKVGDFYLAGMDSAAIEKNGLNPIRQELDLIEAIKNYDDLEKEIARLSKNGIRTLFSFYASQDEKNSDMNIAQISQAGISLPDRDYYVKDDARSKEIREEYIKHLQKMFSFLGDDGETAVKSAQKVMNIETSFAKESMTRLERRDPQKTYNKMSLNDLNKLGKGFDWVGWFAAMDMKDPGDINVHQTEYVKAMGKIVHSFSINDWKTYLNWKLINFAAPYLSKDIVEQDFAFFGKVLSGQKINRPRWKRVQGSTNSALGEAVGELYVNQFFPPEAKVRMQKLVENLRKSLHNRIENVSWMSDVTKKKAIEKLQRITVKVGYPDKWIDYSSLDVDRDSYYANVVRARAFDIERYIEKVNKPVDRGEWHMYPQMVNAYYNPNSNEIVFPAAILQPPFFFMDGDDAVNYGAIGLVIGHEMTHGFDDQGRQYDKDGNLQDWWTEEDATKFKEAADGLVKVYNNFAVLDSLHVDGELTLGENIADLGGINVSFDALQMALKDHNPGKIDGFTPEQRFFLSYAQVWRQNIRPKALMRRLKEDVHSPGHARVYCPLSQVQAFYDAFDVKPGQKMYVAPEDRVVIW